MTTRRAPLRLPTWPWLAILWIGLVLARGNAAGAGWPEGYVVAEDTTSPDGRYGIVIPVGDGTEENWVNYLADLKEKRLLGAIKGFDFFQRQSHASLRATWAADSRWGVAELGSRFGFASLVVLEPADGVFAQMGVGAHIQKALDAAIARPARGKETSGDASLRFRLGPDRTLRVRATASTNPKRFEDRPTFCAAFAGTFDLRARRWLDSRGFPLGKKDYDATESAYATFGDDDFLVLPAGKEPPEGFRGEVFRTEEQRAEKLDAILNDVYRLVRLTLPPARFTAVKAEQIAWLKRRDAQPSAPEKAKLTGERIKILQGLLW